MHVIDRFCIPASLQLTTLPQHNKGYSSQHAVRPLSLSRQSSVLPPHVVSTTSLLAVVVKDYAHHLPSNRLPAYHHRSPVSLSHFRFESLNSCFSSFQPLTPHSSLVTRCTRRATPFVSLRVSEHEPFGRIHWARGRNGVVVQRSALAGPDRAPSQAPAPAPASPGLRISVSTIFFCLNADSQGNAHPKLAEAVAQR